MVIGKRVVLEISGVRNMGFAVVMEVFKEATEVTKGVTVDIPEAVTEAFLQ